MLTKIKIPLQTACLFIAISLSIHSFAQTKYYVATSAQGGNDANTGTSLAAPFATVTKAISKVVAGDTIFVRSGTYTVSTTVSISKAGTATNHIVLTVYQPDMVDANSRPVFDFSSMTLSSSNRGFNLSGANYWDIYGIVIKGAGDNGMNVTGTSYTTITFCSFTRNRDTGLQMGGLSHHLYITNCDSYENADLGTGSTTAGGNADGFSPKLDVGDSIFFRGCRAWMNSDDGWDGYLRPSNNVTTFLEDCWAFRNGYYWLDGSTTTSENGNGFKMGGSDNKDLAHNFVVVKSLAFYNKANGYDQNSNAGSIYLYNCSAYQNLGRDYFMTSGSVTYQPGATLVIKNCMSLGSKGVSLPTASTSSRTYTASNNSFSTATTSPEILSFDTTGVSGMRGVDGSLPNINFMHLNPAAPQPYTYIDKGTVISDVVYHGTSGIPYNGAAPDLGAFESSYGTLPIKMLSFSAYNNSNDVTLNWAIASEINNKGWSIERTSDINNSNWTPLGFVNGKNNSSSVTNYAYIDKNVSAGTYYYRLKQIDVDGRITFSNVILVKVINGKQVAEVALFPNPFMLSATVRYNVPATSKVTLAVFNQQGQLVTTLYQGEQQAGTYQRVVNGQYLAKGKYYLKLILSDQTITNSFIKE
jgi:hypothetical protein